jgi:hypothetical protein
VICMDLHECQLEIVNRVLASRNKKGLMKVLKDGFCFVNMNLEVD